MEKPKDATTEFVSDTASIDIKEFYVGGESKRGWATWLTAAVDKRVSAAVPVVMDLMSMSSVRLTGLFSDFFMILKH